MRPTTSQMRNVSSVMSDLRTQASYASGERKGSSYPGSTTRAAQGREGARLDLGLGQLARGCRIGDDAAAHRQQQPPAPHGGGPDRDRQVQIAGGTQPS